MNGYRIPLPYNGPSFCRALETGFQEAGVNSISKDYLCLSLSTPVLCHCEQGYRWLLTDHSSGWWNHLHNIKVWGKAASAGVEAAASYTEDLAKITIKSNYTKQQIFNVGETALFWKKTLSRSFITKDEKSMNAWLQSFKDRADAASNWSWSQCSFTILKIIGPLRIMLNLSACTL